MVSPGRSPGSASDRSLKLDTWSQHGDVLLALWLLLVMVAARVGDTAGEAPVASPACTGEHFIVGVLTALQQVHVYYSAYGMFTALLQVVLSTTPAADILCFTASVLQQEPVQANLPHTCA